MPIQIDPTLSPASLLPDLERLFDIAGRKIVALDRTWDPRQGGPVFTVRGRYTTRGWTEWTQGFQFGLAALEFDATGDIRFLEIARRNTVQVMAPHVSHIGVHDHGFNNLSTYGNLLRLIRERRIAAGPAEVDFHELALKTSGAVQAARWTRVAGGGGYIYSFNGPHSLFIDTMRSLRSLAVAHALGHVLMGEHEERISLLGRLLAHGVLTARHAIYYGMGRDAYDVRGRTAHESIFNLNDGHYRCPNSQQGYSPFSTWTRGLAWALLGFAEQLEFLATRPDRELATHARGAGLRLTAAALRQSFLEAASATADFYLEHACADGIPVWDTGAPNLHRLGDYAHRPSDPGNAWEPVDSSAAAIAAQGLLRLGNHLIASGRRAAGRRHRQAGLTVARALLGEPYLATSPTHQGLLLHSVYHRPNGWDHVARDQKIPNGESSMWGDYHLMELAVMLQREARGDRPLRFFGCL